MIAKARGRFIQVSTRKMRSVARLLRGVEVLKAQAILKHLPKRACQPISKPRSDDRAAACLISTNILDSLQVCTGVKLWAWRSGKITGAIR